MTKATCSIFLILSTVTFISCKSDKRREFYENGILTEVQIYNSDKKLDSTIFYYPPPFEGKIKEIRIWRKELSTSKMFDEKGVIISEGLFKGSNPMERIGNWIFYSKSYDSIVEYMQVDGKSYTNQIWLINPKGDTLKTRGNYFYFNAKDTVLVNEVIRLNFYLFRPYNSYSSNVEVILPANDQDLKNDFSNLFEIERDTFASLKNDQIPHSEIPMDTPTNHLVEFGLIYSEPGVKRIRGALIEYSDRNNNDIELPDSINRLERRLYFDTSIYVKDVKE